MRTPIAVLVLVLAACGRTPAPPDPLPKSASATPAAKTKAMLVNVERTTATCAAISACESDCKGSQPGACAKLSRLVGPLGSDATTAKRAVELVQTSCLADGDAKACDEYAGFMSAGILVKRDEARANELWGTASKAFRSACDHGDHVACRDAEDIVRKGHGVPRDEKMFTELHVKAVSLYAKACPAGDLDACEQLASEGDDDAKKAELLKKLCDAGRPEACMSIAQGMPDGKSRTALEDKVQSTRKKLCLDEKNGLECLKLGTELDAQTLQPKYRKPELALPIFRAGCDLANHQSCLRASSILAHAGKTDEALAMRKRYLEMVEGLCALPMPVACANLSFEYKHGDDLPLDEEKARTFAKKACEGGLKDACSR